MEIKKKSEKICIYTKKLKKHDFYRYFRFNLYRDVTQSSLNVFFITQNKILCRNNIGFMGKKAHFRFGLPTGSQKIHDA